MVAEKWQGTAQVTIEREVWGKDGPSAAEALFEVLKDIPGIRMDMNITVKRSVFDEESK